MSLLSWSTLPISGKPRPDEETGSTFKELAQDGHGVERAAQRTGEFLPRLAARSRALCAPNSFMLSVVRTDATGRFIRVSIPMKRAHSKAALEESPHSFSNLIEEASRRYGVDPLLVQSLINVESNANPAAASPKGAQGLMQLIPSTARRFGVEDPFDPKQNIEGGVRYLKHLQTLFPSDLTLSIAAYNSGERAVAKYKTVPPYAETLGYVQKVSRQYTRLQSDVAMSDRHMDPAPAPERHVEERIDSEGRLYLRTR